MGWVGFEDVDGNLRFMMRLDVEKLRARGRVYIDERVCWSNHTYQKA